MSSEWKPTNNPKDALGTAKAPLHLIPAPALAAMSMAFLEGREKYGQYNWRVTGVRASIYHAALLRHMLAWFDGEYVDPDSGLPHLWKAIACLAILIDADALGALEDDRPPQAPTAELMQRTKELGESIRKRLQCYDPYQYTEKNRHDGPQEDTGPKFRDQAEVGEVESVGPSTPAGDTVLCPHCFRTSSYVHSFSRITSGGTESVREFRCPEHGIWEVSVTD